MSPSLLALLLAIFFLLTGCPDSASQQLGLSDYLLQSKIGLTQEINYLSCCEFCCKLSTAVWDLPIKKSTEPFHYFPSSELLKACPHLEPFSYLEIKRFFVPTSQLPPTENCRSALLYLVGCIFFPLSAAPLCFSCRIVCCIPQMHHAGLQSLKILLCVVMYLDSAKT